jgi:hypothetical protein
MGASDDRWAAVTHTRIDVASRVNPVMQTPLLEALEIPATGCHVGFAEGGTPDTAVWSFADFSEGLEVLSQAIKVNAKHG